MYAGRVTSWRQIGIEATGFPAGPAGCDYRRGCGTIPRRGRDRGPQGRVAASRAWCKGRSLPCTAVEAEGRYEHPWGATRGGVAQVQSPFALKRRSWSARGTFWAR